MAITFATSSGPAKIHESTATKTEDITTHAFFQASFPAEDWYKCRQ